MLLVGNEHRGNDASGVALSQDDGSVQVCKSDDAPWRFVSTKGYKDFIEENLKPTTWGAIVHARLASQGNPRKNENNHPMFSGACAVIHNGVISNDDTLFKDLKLKRSAETDSDIIRAIIDEHGFSEKAYKNLNKICGSVAAAVFHPEFKHRILLLRSGSPMSLASTENMFVFASEQDTIYKAMKPFVERFGQHFQVKRPDLAFSPMANDTLTVVGRLDNGDFINYHREFKALKWSYTEPNRRTYEDYSSRQSRFDSTHKDNKKDDTKEKDKDNSNKKLVVCPKCGKEWVIPKNANAYEYTCPTEKNKGGCGNHLMEKRSLVQ
jgi:glucosamine 6-phosphate synthetase-like amidotransferase/phosphosugar isomerase protein